MFTIFSSPEQKKINTITVTHTFHFPDGIREKDAIRIQKELENEDEHMAEYYNVRLDTFSNASCEFSHEVSIQDTTNTPLSLKSHIRDQHIVWKENGAQTEPIELDNLGELLERDSVFQLDDNSLILKEIRQRLSKGAEEYKHGIRINEDTTNFGTKKNDWMEMAMEELMDGLVYGASAIIRHRQHKMKANTENGQE